MTRKRKPRRAPSLESLEDRCVPAVFVPTTFDDGGEGNGSLRDAVLSSNANPEAGTDFILLQAGTYRLTIQNDDGQENAAATGDLDLTSTVHRLIISGAGSSGPNATIIDGGGLQDRIFHLVQAGVQVVPQNLVVTGGRAVDNGTDGALSADTDARGGGVLSDGGFLQLVNVVVANNAARGDVGRDALGGGLHAVGGVVVSLGQTRFEDNVAQSGVGKRGTNGTRTPPRNPTLGESGGDAQGGGAYVADGVFLFLDTTFADNVAQGGKGGEGEPTTSSSGPIPGVAGGSGGHGQGGGVYLAGGMVGLVAAHLRANEAAGGAGGGGGDGGIGQNGFEGTTSSEGNPNGGPGGNGGAGGVGGNAQGGGLYVGGGTMTLDVSSSITQNRVTVGRSGAGGRGGRGGLPLEGGIAGVDGPDGATGADGVAEGADRFN